jgi:hypothetical protein
MDSDELDYLWNHFVFNAEQRLKAFNFFVVFSVFANGGVFTVAEKGAHPFLFVLIGGFVVILSIVFWLMDVRSHHLVRLAVPALKEYEKQFAAHSRLFALDEPHTKTLRRYTVAFRALFVVQLLFGIGAIAFGLVKWFCSP